MRFGGICEERSPSLRLSPNRQYASAKQLPATRSYTLFLTNEDSTDCEPRAFPLTSRVTAGWSGKLSIANPTAAPGATVDATVAVTAPKGTPQGSYPVGMTVRLGGEAWRVDATMPDQELDSRQSTGTVYWEGAAAVSRDGKRVGAGYLELTGYADRLRF